ncbi:hypothetical protein LCGC14_3004680, partial [marine sediment metagenome]
RAIGVSNFGVSYLKEIVAAGRVETNQLPYNLLFRPIEFQLKPLCETHDIGILCYSALAHGLLTGKFASADDVPAGRARTRHFSKDREHTRHGEPGCEAETFAAIDTLRTICEDIGQPMARVALAWLMAQSNVTAVIAGARNAQQAADNAAAADLELDDDVCSKLNGATRAVKQHLATNADPWQHDSRMER